MRVLPIITGLSLFALLALAFSGCGGGGGAGGGTNNGSVTVAGQVATYQPAGAAPYEVVAYFKSNGTVVHRQNFTYQNGAWTLNLTKLSTAGGDDTLPPPPPMFSPYQPDLLIRTETDALAGGDIYEKPLEGTYNMEVRKVVNLDGSLGELVQSLEVDLNITGSQLVEQAPLTAASYYRVYYARLENDGSNPDTFKLTGTNSDANWSVSYFDRPVGGTDITAQVTGSGYTVTPPVASMGAVANQFRIEVRPNGAAAKGTKKTVRLTATSAGDSTDVDTVWMATSLAP